MKSLHVIKKKPWLISLICALFMLYPNIAWFLCDLSFVPQEDRIWFYVYFVFRALWFWGLIWLLIWLNLNRIRTKNVIKRMFWNLLMSMGGFVVFELVTITYHYDTFISILIFQFIVIGLLTSMIGYIYLLMIDQHEKEREIERLQIESLQSRCDALMNQINPHFFFNSLNGISSLIRKEEEDGKVLEYVSKLSDVFRYILQSDRKGLVTLDEELKFAEAFSHVMEVRFANKLTFDVDVPEGKRNLTLPVLSLIPLLENVTVHNIIDSEHQMNVRIYLNSSSELVVSNPVYPKLTEPDTNGIGLKNLQSRFELLTGKEIKIKTDGSMFEVRLPLK